jgi:hypothetical protein
MLICGTADGRAAGTRGARRFSLRAGRVGTIGETHDPIRPTYDGAGTGSARRARIRGGILRCSGPHGSPFQFHGAAPNGFVPFF